MNSRLHHNYRSTAICISSCAVASMSILLGSVLVLGAASLEQYLSRNPCARLCVSVSSFLGQSKHVTVTIVCYIYLRTCE